MGNKAIDVIKQLLFADPELEWTCNQVAVALGYTVRTVAREIGLLHERGLAERCYGKQKRMTFKAKPPIVYPAWMDPIGAAAVAQLSVVGSRVHILEDDE